MANYDLRAVHKSVVERLVFEVMNGGRLDLIDELFTPDAAAVAREWIAPFLAFPDVLMEIVELIAEGDSPHVPDPQTMPRDAYVNAALLEEARATILEIRNHQQLARVRDGVSRVGLQREYEGTYAMAVMAVMAENNARLLRGQPELAPAQEERVGVPAGLARVLKDFHDGEAKPSSSEGREDYVEAYERAWDQAN